MLGSVSPAPQSGGGCRTAHEKVGPCEPKPAPRTVFAMAGTNVQADGRQQPRDSVPARTAALAVSSSSRLPLRGTGQTRGAAGGSQADRFRARLRSAADKCSPGRYQGHTRSCGPRRLGHWGYDALVAIDRRYGGASRWSSRRATLLPSRSFRQCPRAALAGRAPLVVLAGRVQRWHDDAPKNAGDGSDEHAKGASELGDEQRRVFGHDRARGQATDTSRGLRSTPLRGERGYSRPSRARRRG